MTAKVNKKLLGIDYGSKRVGVAVSDEEGNLAFPKVVLENSGNLAQAIADIYKKEDAHGVVMGESKDYKGRANEVMKDIVALKDVLERELSMEVHMEPEYMTSMQAARLPERMRRGQEYAQGKNDKLDASAAAIILQSFLDKNRDKDI